MTLIKPVKRAKLTKNGYEYVVRGRKVWFQQYAEQTSPATEHLIMGAIVIFYGLIKIVWRVVDAKTGYVFADNIPNKKCMRDKTYSAVVKAARKATRLNLTLSKYLKNAKDNLPI